MNSIPPHGLNDRDAKPLGFPAGGRATAAFAGIHRALLEAERQHPELDLLGHSRRVEAVTTQLCLAMGMPQSQADAVGAAAYFHDVGKLYLPADTLAKDGPLSFDEQASVAQHCEIGARLLRQEATAFARIAENIALWHHQHFNGGGYPGGLVGHDIPLEARIAAVADVYDALRSARPYKPALGHDDAFSILVHGDDRSSPSAFDPEVLRAFGDCQYEMSITWDCAALRHLGWQMEWFNPRG